MKLLTISIAAYNVEKFLDKTLSSLCNESISEDVEVLIIDDGSKDKTSDIAKKYEKKNPKIFKYVYKENGGHGSTINKGIELAQGKYFRVLDGDDYFSLHSRLFTAFGCCTACASAFRLVGLVLVLYDGLAFLECQSRRVLLLRNLVV